MKYLFRYILYLIDKFRFRKYGESPSRLRWLNWGFLSSCTRIEFLDPPSISQKDFDEIYRLLEKDSWTTTYFREING